jgi:hypothetical protein
MSDWSSSCLTTERLFYTSTAICWPRVHISRDQAAGEALQRRFVVVGIVVSQDGPIYLAGESVRMCAAVMAR